MHRLLWIVVGFLACSNLAMGGPTLSDAEAKAVVEASWKAVFARLDLGKFEVVTGGADNSKGTISTNGYNVVLNWQKVGLIVVAADQQYENFRSGKGFSTSQWFELTQQGIQKKIVISATERGSQYRVGDHLRIPQGTFTVTKIIRNEERKKGVDDYRLLMFTYDATWSPEYRAFSSESGRPLSDKRKAMMLFRFDPFDSKWKRIAADLSNADEDFKTKNVASALAQ